MIALIAFSTICGAILVVSITGCVFGESESKRASSAVTTAVISGIVGWLLGMARCFP